MAEESAACGKDDHAISTEGIMGLVRALLVAGAQCVLLSLWPVPDTPVKILLRTFYSSLLQVSFVCGELC
jgi:CHAT domain-containing protein